MRYGCGQSGNLLHLLHSATFAEALSTDEELAAFVQNFEAEMYTRAFKVVKASETATTLDLTKLSGKIMVVYVRMAAILLGWLFLALETVGLKTEKSQTMYYTRCSDCNNLFI